MACRNDGTDCDGGSCVGCVAKNPYLEHNVNVFEGLGGVWNVVCWVKMLTPIAQRVIFVVVKG